MEIVEKTPIPPESLEELRNLYVQMSRGEHAIRMSRRSLKVMKAMLDAPSETAAKSISELAAENEVHISTITRLGKKLGLDGYQGLKNLFRNNLAGHRSFYSRQVKNFLNQEHGRRGGDKTIVDQVVEDEWSNVMVTLDSFEERNFAAVVDLITRAEHIFVLGLRGCYPVAYYLSFYLQMIRDHVSLAGNSGHMLGEDFAGLKKGDLVIAIGVAPYTRETVEVCRLCRQQDIDLVAITDGISSPLASETSNFLVAAIQGSYFFSPVVALIIYVEALLSELVVRMGDEAVRRLNHTENILDKFNIEI